MIENTYKDSAGAFRRNAGGIGVRTVRGRLDASGTCGMPPVS